MFEGLGNTFKGFWKYALGRGVITLGVLAAASAASIPGLSIIFPIAIAASSVAWNVFSRHLDQQRYENRMLDFYKDEVAVATGKELGDLTVGDLKKTAYGDPDRGVPRNDVLAYALDRQSAKSWLGLATAIISGAVTFGLLQMGIASDISNFLQLDSGIGTTLSGVSAGIVAGGSSLLINNGLDRMIGNATRVHHLSAHDRILRIERTQLRGKSVDPIQVMDVFVAANPQLTDRLKRQYGESYQGMNRSEKATAIKELGVTSLMNKLAEGLSTRAIDATELAFISNGAEPLTARGKATLASTKQEAEKVAAPAAETPRFVERVGGSRRNNQSFAERVEQSRADTPAQSIA